MQLQFWQTEALRRLTEGHERFRRGEARMRALRRSKLRSIAEGTAAFRGDPGLQRRARAARVDFRRQLWESFSSFASPDMCSRQGLRAACNTRITFGNSLVRGARPRRLRRRTCHLESRDQGIQQQSRIQILVQSILPGLPDFDSGCSPKARLSQAVEANVRRTCGRLGMTRKRRRVAAASGIKVIGAIYDPESRDSEMVE